MKEYLFPIVQETAGRTIVIDDVPETMTVDNILAIINKTQGKPVIGPLNMGDITDFDFDDGTITITFSNNLPALAAGDKLLVKCFTETDIEATLTAILAAIPTECSNADIDHMFEAITEDGYILIPSVLIDGNGTMPIGMFTAVTSLTPIE